MGMIDIPELGLVLICVTKEKQTSLLTFDPTFFISRDYPAGK